MGLWFDGFRLISWGILAKNEYLSGLLNADPVEYLHAK